MPEKQSIYSFEKQEAKGNIVNVAGDYIILHPITHEPVYIPSIQSVLRKGETTEGDFFKKEPEWVDYEQGFIVERKEVDEIIRKLETNKVQLVLGAPASGKSIILKNVGFKLAGEGKKVYVVELKKHPQDEIKLFFDNIPKIDDDNPIFIIDDAHLNISECERLIRNFKGIGKGKLIIGSRETEEIEKGDTTKSSEFEYLSKTATKIRAENVSEEMIRTFLKAKNHLGNERIKFVSSNLEKFKKDLWYLSWALKSYNPVKDSVEESEIYDNIKDRIREINGEDVFLPLSVFYRYEIPIERRFLEKQLGIDKVTIEQLIGLSEIVETEEKGKPIMLSLNHSSLAELYYGGYLNYPSLGEGIREKILNDRDDKYLEFCSFYRYITSTDPRNALRAIIHLGDWWWIENREILLANLIDINEVQESIIKGIKKEQDIADIGDCIWFIAETNKDVGLNLINQINIDILLSKINEEMELEKIGLYVQGIAQANEKIAEHLIDAVLAKIEEETELEKIGLCVGDIALASEKIAEPLIDAVSAKIEKETKIEKIELCLEEIIPSSEKLALKLVNSIDIDALSAKIDIEANIEKIRECFFTIACLNTELATKLAENINIKTLSSKMDKEENIEKVGMCIFRIADTSKEMGLKLINQIDIDILLSKFEKEDDISRIGRCLFDISEVNKEISTKLIENISTRALSAKIDKEEDIEKVGLCASRIACASKEMAQKLLDSIDIDALYSKIDKEADIQKVGMCASYIAYASKEMAQRLLDSIDIVVLSSKINKEDFIIKIGWCISIIAKVSEEAALKLVDSVSARLNKEEDMEIVGSCLADIAKVNKEVANEIINHLNPKLREKLQQRIHF